MLTTVQQQLWANKTKEIKMAGKKLVKKMVARSGIEPLSCGIFTYIASMFGKMSITKKMVARSGIEPLTQGFSVPCSTN